MAGIDMDAPIRRLVPEDAARLTTLSIEAGWNQVEADWRWMLENGQGYGIADGNGAWLASAVTLPLGAHLAWISMVLVATVARGRGFATRLLAECCDTIAASGRVAGLDATELGRPVYRRLGFREVYPLSRWQVPNGIAARAMAHDALMSVRSMSDNDVRAIATYDAAHSGLERGHLLDALRDRMPKLATIARDAHGRIVGFALARGGRRASQIGPVVADSEAIAQSLIQAVMAQTNTPVILDVPDRHRGLTTWLAGQGATAPRGFVRMLHGHCPGLETPACVFALAGPELA